MDRRTFLKTSGVLVGALGSGTLLSACGQPSGIPDVQPSLNVIDASFETLTGDPRRFVFGLTTAPDNVPVTDPDVQVYTRDLEGEITGGPYEAQVFEEGPAGLSVYRTELALPDPGQMEIVVVSDGQVGINVINVVRPEDSPLPVPGDPAVATPTPTTEAALGLAEVCTRDPDCSMHDMSLDDALATGRPVVLMFATPAYCQTAVCGPAVDTLEGIKDDRDWGEIVFIHAEIFTDAGTTVAEHVQAWGLQSEPWLFTIDAEGNVMDRVDGVMIGEEIRELVERLA